MIFLRAALILLFPAAAAAQILSGGAFEMNQHGLGPVAQGEFTSGGSTLSFSGSERGLSAPYPLQNGGMSLTPTPGGVLRYQSGQSNIIISGSARVFLSGQSVPSDFDFFINPDPAVSPLRINPASLAQANARLSATAGPQAALAPGSVFEFNLLSDSGAFYDGTLNSPAVVTLSYPDLDGDGVVDGSNIRAKTLGVYALDEAHNLWVRLAASSVDPAARTVTALTTHFSVYALVGTSDQDVLRAHPYPVPWAPNSGNPAVDGTLAGGITFTDLPSEGTISIFTLSGQLVRALSIIPFNPQRVWDVRTAGGQDVVSGVYLWRLKSGDNVKVGKLIVIR